MISDDSLSSDTTKAPGESSITQEGTKRRKRQPRVVAGKNSTASRSKSTEETKKKKSTEKKAPKQVAKSSSNNTSQKTGEYKTTRNELYTLFYYTNKPFIITELSLRFKDVGKKQLEKVLDDLEEKKLITIKLNGKTKVYVLNQDNLKYRDEENSTQEKENDKTTSQSSKKQFVTMSTLKKTQEVLTQKLSDVTLTNNQLSAEVAELSNELSTEMLRKKIQEFELFIQENIEFESVELADEAEFETVSAKMGVYTKMESQRKKIIKEIVDTVSDGLGMKKKEFMEEAGIGQE